MHILFFSHYFWPEGNAPANRTYENCKQWVKSGHKVTVITCSPNVPNGVVYDGYKNRLFQRQSVDGIDVIRIWTYIAANKGTIKRIFNYLSYLTIAFFVSLFLKKPDCIIATSPQFFCGWAGLLASRFKNVPFILEIRDLWPDSIVAVGAMKNKRLLRILEWLEIKMYKAAFHIVTVGDGYKLKLIEKNVRPQKISVIPNGIDPDIFCPMAADRTIIEKYNLQNKFVCSYIGTIGMACGLEIVVEAADKLKQKGQHNIVILLVGDGASKKQLETLAKEKNLDNIVFTGRQDKEFILALLSTSDVCLVHLKKTGLFETVIPSKIFEAASMAKPIILGVGGFAAELVKKAGAGICIEPENPHQLVEALEKLATDHQLAVRLGQGGKDYVRKFHNRSILAQNYLEIVRSVCPVEPKTGAIVLDGK